MADRPHSQRNANGINIESGVGKWGSGLDLPRLKPGQHLEADESIKARKGKVMGSGSYVAQGYAKPVTDDIPKPLSRFLVYGAVATTCFLGGIGRRYAIKNGLEPIEIFPSTNVHFLYPLILVGSSIIGGKYERDRGTTEYFEGACGVVAGGLVGIISEAAGEFVGSLFI